MTAVRKIIHLDLDAFFCAVEELHDPTLRGKKFAVGGSPDGRGVISSCSYAARKYGVRSAMPTSQALRRCPGLILLSVNHPHYSEYSHRVIAVMKKFTPLVEQVSIDEAFLDVSDLPEPIADIARTIQKEINGTTHLPCSLGGATNKLVAKIANNIGKKSVKTDTYPNAITCIPPGHEAAFLAPLPVSELWGVGQKSAALLKNLGIITIGQLASYPLPMLLRKYGNSAASLQAHARGIDNRPVQSEAEIAKSISQETTFSRDVDDEARLRRMIQRQSDQVGFRLRKANLRGDTVKIKLRWGDFQTLTRQVKTNGLVNQDSQINDYAQKLFDAVWLKDPKPVRLIGVGVTGLEHPVEQLELFTGQNQRGDSLMQALDEIRLRYGKNSLKRCIELESRTITFPTADESDDPL
jgi:DNA polymerase-4